LTLTPLLRGWFPVVPLTVIDGLSMVFTTRFAGGRAGATPSTASKPNCAASACGRNAPNRTTHHLRQTLKLTER
jgi:hypothetical protein